MSAAKMERQMAVHSVLLMAACWAEYLVGLKAVPLASQRAERMAGRLVGYLVALWVMCSALRMVVCWGVRLVGYWATQ